MSDVALTDLERFVAAGSDREAFATPWSRWPRPYIGVGAIYVLVSPLAPAGVSWIAEQLPKVFDGLEHVAMLLSLVLAWWPFVLWVRRTRAQAAAVIRHGVVLVGTVRPSWNGFALVTCIDDSRARTFWLLDKVYSHSPATAHVLCRSD